jgi:hypothetical protein
MPDYLDKLCAQCGRWLLPDGPCNRHPDRNLAAGPACSDYIRIQSRPDGDSGRKYPSRPPPAKPDPLYVPEEPGDDPD